MTRVMRGHGILCLVLMMIFVSGCDGTLDDVPRIASEDLRDKCIAGQAIIVDVRSLAAYEQLHISGALSIPYVQIAVRAGELPRNKLVATYCT